MSSKKREWVRKKLIAPPKGTTNHKTRTLAETKPLASETQIGSHHRLASLHAKHNTNFVFTHLHGTVLSSTKEEYIIVSDFGCCLMFSRLDYQTVCYIVLSIDLTFIRYFVKSILLGIKRRTKSNLRKYLNDDEVLDQ